MFTAAHMILDHLAAYLGRHEEGQNMIETSLIIGVISVALVSAFIVSGVQAGITELSRDVACQISGGNAPGVNCGGVVVP